jgi:hypothetical protein
MVRRKTEESDTRRRSRCVWTISKDRRAARARSAYRNDESKDSGPYIRMSLARNDGGPKRKIVQTPQSKKRFFPLEKGTKGKRNEWAGLVQVPDRAPLSAHFHGSFL